MTDGPGPVEPQRRVPIPELWTTAQAAAHCGVTPSTFRSYLRRLPGLTPVPNIRSEDGSRLFVPDEVKAWHAKRPGRGTRTDLKKQGETDVD